MSVDSIKEVNSDALGYRTAIDIALMRNQIVALTMIIDYIVNH